MPLLKAKDLEKPTAAAQKEERETVVAFQDAIKELQGALDGIVPDSFRYWLTFDPRDGFSIAWALEEGENGGYIQRLTDSNPLKLIKTLHRVDWDKQIQIANREGEHFRDLSRELDEFQARVLDNADGN